MPVKPLLCQNCGAAVSLRENRCKCCGVKYVFEAGKVIMNQHDVEKIECDEKSIRDNLPKHVLRMLALYPEERIVFKHNWKNLKDHFLVTNEKIIFYEEDMTDHWVIRFKDFGGSSIDQERNTLSRLDGVPFLLTLKLRNSKDDVWLRLPGIFPPGTSYSTLKTAIDNAYGLWLTKNRTSNHDGDGS